jgi:predicted KAP-like P-loop ATPase
VVAITGPWGSGKSSVLNLLCEELKTRKPEPLIVRFNPWLIANRNDLISQFFADLVAGLKTPTMLGHAKQIVERLTRYVDRVAPVVDLAMPGLGLAVPGLGAVAGGVRRAISAPTRPLDELRGQLMRDLAAFPVPIVVAIDELDRVDDDEVLAVAQLIRAVADFPGVSYVLAYDQDRVAQALGAGASEEDRKERGRSYLEKIVQFQIPLPALSDEELSGLLGTELAIARRALGLSEWSEDGQRYLVLRGKLVSRMIRTPREIKRLCGTYQCGCPPKSLR